MSLLRFSRLRGAAVALSVIGGLAASNPRDAAACGGCFVPTTERTVVTDHRMALAVSRERTVLWDQIRYSGDPAEFAWVLPVRGGAKLELANDELFTALDASTQPVVVAPNRFGGAMGCGLTGCAATSDSASGGPGAGQVQVLSQSVVGPYETVTLRATDPDALTNWLRSRAFAIPDSIAPTIRAYVDEQFDFLALRLRPGCGERAMQPVRVVTPGADPTLPLRMVAAGVGPRVGITLWVLSEGRYQPSNFPVTTVDDRDVLWNRLEDRSNYEELSQRLMGAANGRTWLVEYANQPQTISYADPFLPYGPSYGSSSAASRSGGFNPGLADTYYGLCRYAPRTSVPSSGGSGSAAPYTPCPKTSVDPGQEAEDAGAETDAAPATDAGADASLDDDADASVDTDAGTDAGADAGAPAKTKADAGASRTEEPTPTGDCRYLDDLQVAFRGMPATSIWVTRLRAVLPADALSAGDLRLEATRSQVAVSNVHYATRYTDEVRESETSGGGSCVSAPREHTTFGSWAVSIAAGIGLVARLRRRARDRRGC